MFFIRRNDGDVSSGLCINLVCLVLIDLNVILLLSLRFSILFIDIYFLCLFGSFVWRRGA